MNCIQHSSPVQTSETKVSLDCLPDCVLAQILSHFDNRKKCQTLSLVNRQFQSVCTKLMDLANICTLGIGIGHQGLQITFESRFQRPNTDPEIKIKSVLQILDTVTNIQTLQLNSFIPLKIRKRLLEQIPKWQKLRQIEVRTDCYDQSSVNMHLFFHKLFNLLRTNPDLSSRIKLDLHAEEVLYQEQGSEHFLKTIPWALASRCTFSKLLFSLEDQAYDQTHAQLTQLIRRFKGAKIEKLQLDRSDQFPNLAVLEWIPKLINSLASETLTEFDHVYECSDSHNETIKLLESINQTQLSKVQTYSIKSNSNPYSHVHGYLTSCARLLSTVHSVLGRMPELCELSYIPSYFEQYPKVTQQTFDLDSFLGLVKILMAQAEKLKGEVKAKFSDVAPEVIDDETEIMAKLLTIFPTAQYKLKNNVKTSKYNESFDEHETRTFKMQLTNVETGGSLNFEWIHNENWDWGLF